MDRLLHYLRFMQTGALLPLKELDGVGLVLSGFTTLSFTSHLIS